MLARAMRRGLGFGAALPITMALVAVDSKPLIAQRDSTARFGVAAFVDLYYAYDFGRPALLDRPYTTTAVRHSELNVNLAHIEARMSGDRTRARLALQAGTSVQANYASEPAVGGVSGPDVSRFIQEATIGRRVAPSLWLDAGVFFAPFGAESWISADNWTYTRSLIADNSPYYQSGIKATWRASDRLNAQLHMVNGWQNVSETNSDKALAARLDYARGDSWSVGYAAFVGNEQPDTSVGALRVFHEVMTRIRLTARLDAAATLDYGSQDRSAARLRGAWRGWALISRYRASDRVAIGARTETYSDPEQIIVATGQAFGLRAIGGSVNLDVAVDPVTLWRVELRGLSSPDRPFTNGAGHSWVAVTSIAMRLGEHGHTTP